MDLTTAFVSITAINPIFFWMINLLSRYPTSHLCHPSAELHPSSHWPRQHAEMRPIMRPGGAQRRSQGQE